jgi:uncharacterized protein (TIGR00730 family)
MSAGEIMKRVCVFCGSSKGSRAVYAEAADGLGALLARRGFELVYGGGCVGLMGIVADAALREGGHVIGVIPEALKIKEVVHEGLPDLRVVKSMHERKALMADLSDAFVALPGGFGTYEEFCEVLTWGQLGLHTKPFGLFNVAGYYDSLLSLFDHAVAEGFIRPAHRDMVLVESDPEKLLDRLTTFHLPKVEKWIRHSET